ncbi:MAG: 5-oxoprolinase subunit PxpB [Pyrinomonadaceae bacterium]
MTDTTIRIFPLGDSALTVEFGRSISEQLNRKAIALADHFDALKFPGFIEAVPAYSSTTIFYDLIAVRKSFPEFPTAFDAVSSLASNAVRNVDISSTGSRRSVEIPVHFDEGSALDMNEIADHSGLTPDEVIEVFTSRSYRVFMLGFLPGFSYMGEIDDRIAIPRKDSPRTLVPKGSIGLAGNQTGIYSLDSPGGWQIIGRTDIEMFTPGDETPCFLQAGDEVRFIVHR